MFRHWTLIGLLLATSVGVFHGVLGGVVQEDNRLTVRCTFTGPMIGSVPHPYDECHKFYICAPAPAGSTTPTIPYEMDCPMGTNGPLYYDFKNCTCQYEDSVCYKPMIDNADFFTCAEPFDPTKPQPILKPY